MNKNAVMIGLTTILIISGCSKKMEDSGETAAADAAMTKEAMVAEADTVEPAVQTATNPEQLLATQQSMLEQNRKLVKNSQLSFEVTDIQKTTQIIEKKLLEMNGYVEIKQVDYRVEDYESKNKLDGTVDIFEKITPTTQLIIRIPNAQVTDFLNSLLPLMKNFNQQNYEAKRYELKLLEEKMNTANQAGGSSNAVMNQLQRLTQLEVQDRLQFSTISINYYQKPQLRQREDINIQRIANIHSDPFFARIWQSMKMGFIGIREVIVWITMLWPGFIIAAIIWWIFGLRRKQKIKSE